MTTTPLLEINLLEESQNLKYLTVNESTLILEAIAIGRFNDFLTDVANVSDAGELFIVAATGTVGILIGQEDKLAYYDGTNLTIYEPQADLILYNTEDNQQYIYGTINGWILFELGELSFTIPTTNLASGASYEFEIATNNLIIVELEFTTTARLRLYPNNGARIADNAIATVDATDDDIFDVELLSGSSPKRYFKPIRLRSSGGEIAGRVFNTSGSTDDVELTIHYLLS